MTATLVSFPRFSALGATKLDAIQTRAVFELQPAFDWRQSGKSL